MLTLIGWPGGKVKLGSTGPLKQLVVQVCALVLTSKYPKNINARDPQIKPWNNERTAREFFTGSSPFLQLGSGLRSYTCSPYFAEEFRFVHPFVGNKLR